MTNDDPQPDQPPAVQTYVPPLTAAPYASADAPGHHVPAQAAAPAPRGKILVLAVLATVLLLQLAVAGLTYARFGSDRLNGPAIRILLNLGLSLFVYQGRTWARIVMVVLLSLGALVAVVGGVQVLELGGVAWLLFGMAAIYGACAGILLFSKSVTDFLDWQGSRG